MFLAGAPRAKRYKQVDYEKLLASARHQRSSAEEQLKRMQSLSKRGKKSRETGLLSQHREAWEREHARLKKEKKEAVMELEHWRADVVLHGSEELKAFVAEVTAYESELYDKRQQFEADTVEPICVCKITTLSDKSTICSSFGMDKENSEPIETASSNEGIPLCTYHYGILYRHLNPSHLKCKTCSKHISDITKSQAVPEPGMIGAFLSENTDSNESISSNDRVCFTCYKSHLLLLKHLKGSVKSTDSDLKTSIVKHGSENTQG